MCVFKKSKVIEKERNGIKELMFSQMHWIVKWNLCVLKKKSLLIWLNWNVGKTFDVVFLLDILCLVCLRCERIIEFYAYKLQLCNLYVSYIYGLFGVNTKVREFQTIKRKEERKPKMVQLSYEFHNLNEEPNIENELKIKTKRKKMQNDSQST